MPKRTRFIFALLLFFVLLGLPLSGQAETQADNLKDQLNKLSRNQNITIKNTDIIQPAAPIKVSGSIEEQLKQLLVDYNFVQLSNSQGNIEKIIIMSVKRYDHSKPVATETPDTNFDANVKTTRNGSHHLVQTELSGPNGAKIKLSLLVDTGATSIVLPASFQAKLGFNDHNLQSGISETANGRIETLHGTLKSVTVGNASAKDVEVSFIADDKLHNSGLLGMSFLGRFQLMVDDAQNQITLKSSTSPRLD
ncbi:MAG: retropepsin-like aspartic protease [Methylicorpusculum sp.]|uniref:retropepsin-like aspartic protease family protein n=1 Tax=Methylicorpusculum sp. TaxID=2713644 RepID=UPI00271E04CB|nr:retropepsin-like aspartic protease [Methylicorpusculum sp.]MDO8843927.1 retropepsin-like aspartic protease [Methylicorpusculum sp.]MDO8939184.1 retropepsin-like aspartic protease [Methylicorpusculum sp.]MDO9240497.1 retropepsin-like aspartic protease [Methylicorpusculum sp.]MDP2201573.1 retropepsin-like aspartic protease [Methylicorpusculum sp.]